MVLTHSQQLLLAVLFWLIMIPLLLFIIRQTCSLFRIDMPSYPRAIGILLIVGPLAYLTFDYTAYIIMQLIHEGKFFVAPGYSYSHWMNEPLILKWRILSLVPLMRYIPIIFALCVAGVLQVFMLNLQVTFRVGLLLFLAQVVASIIGAILLSALFHVGLVAVLKLKDAEEPPGLSAHPHYSQKQAAPMQQGDPKSAAPREEREPIIIRPGQGRTSGSDKAE